MKTAKQIATAIAAIGKKSATLRAEIQTTLIDIAGHMVEHGDASLGLKLLNAVGNGANKIALAKWLSEYTAFRMVGNTPTVSKAFRDALAKEFGTDDRVSCREKHEADLLATAPNWYDDGGAQDRKTAEIFDGVKRAELLLSLLTKKAAKGEGTHLDFERFLRTAIDEYKASLIANAAKVEKPVSRITKSKKAKAAPTETAPAADAQQLQLVASN